MTELRVVDPAPSAAWYVAALGFQVTRTDPTGEFILLEAPGGGRLALKRGEPTPGGCLLHLEVADLDAAAARLHAAAASVSPSKISPEGYTRISSTDPSGYTIILFAWLTRDQSRLSE